MDLSQLKSIVKIKTFLPIVAIIVTSGETYLIPYICHLNLYKLRIVSKEIWGRPLALKTRRAIYNGLRCP